MIQLYKEAHNGDFNRRHRTAEEEASLRASGDDGSQAGGEEHSETGEKWGRNEDYPIGDEIRRILEVSSEQLRKFYTII